MATIAEFLQNYIGLQQVFQQKQAAEVAQAATRTGMLNSLLGMAQETTDPGNLQQLVQVGAQLTGMPPEALSELFTRTAPKAGLLGRAAAQEGWDAATPQGRAALSSEAVSREVAGQTAGAAASSQLLANVLGQGIPPEEMDTLAAGARARIATGQDVGSLAQSGATAALPPDILAAGAQIREGTQLSAPQAENARLGWAGEERGWAQLRLQDRIAVGQQALQELGLRIDLQSAAAKAQQGGQLDSLKLLEELGRTSRHVNDMKGRATAAEMAGYVQQINGIKKQLEANGIFQPTPDLTPEQVMQPNRVFGFPGWGR